MEVSKLAKKLLIKPAQRILLINPPENYTDLINPLPREAEIFRHPEGNYDVIQVFVLNKLELIIELERLQDHLRPDTILWICYPKKTSGIHSDLEMMQSWDETATYGLSGVTALSINETWTALRFKPTNQIVRSGVGNAEIEQNELGKYIDVKNKAVVLPPELKSGLEQKPNTLHFFNTLSYTNKKEYITWVLTAKQQKTKDERIKNTLEKLAAGKKNPSEK
ncbi:MAG: YdeI/OmpD-associated family protein [Daejeonella sp.]